MSSIVLCNVGGTKVRFALFERSTICRYRTYLRSEFGRDNKDLAFERALKHYCDSENVVRKGILLVASTGSECLDRWKITEGGLEWDIRHRALHAQGWQVSIINDFEAAAWGLDVDHLSLPLDTVNRGNPTSNNKNRCIIGVGTGLGLAYRVRDTVIPTVGGHMPFSPTSRIQREVARLAVQYKESDFPLLVFEDLLSGSGLLCLYRCVVDMNLIARRDQEVLRLESPEEVTRNLINDPNCEQAVRLLVEILGTFCACAVLYGSAFGGVYLKDSPVIDLFDANDFLRGFYLDGDKEIVTSLKATPVFRLLPLAGEDQEMRGLVLAHKLN